jgi:hypothetical protein
MDSPGWKRLAYTGTCVRFCSGVGSLTHTVVALVKPRDCCVQAPMEGAACA